MKVMDRKDNIYRLERDGAEFFAARMQHGLVLLMVVSNADGTPADEQTRAEAESAIEQWSATQAHNNLCASLFVAAQKAFGLLQ